MIFMKVYVLSLVLLGDIERKTCPYWYKIQSNVNRIRLWWSSSKRICQCKNKISPESSNIFCRLENLYWQEMQILLKSTTVIANLLWRKKVYRNGCGVYYILVEGFEMKLCYKTRILLLDVREILIPFFRLLEMRHVAGGGGDEWGVTPCHEVRTLDEFQLCLL
jgi:hypothetical protein